MLNSAVNSSAQLKCSTQVLNSSAQLDCSTQLVICPGVFSRAGRRAAAGTACVGTRGSRPQQSACRYGTAAAASVVFCRPSQIVLFSRSTTTPSRIRRRQAERNGHARQHDAASAVRRVLDGDVGWRCSLPDPIYIILGIAFHNNMTASFGLLTRILILFFSWNEFGNLSIECCC